jgi:hypothetical protein
MNEPNKAGDLAQEMIDAHSDIIAQLSALKLLSATYGLPPGQLEICLERDLRRACRAWMAERTTNVTVQRWYQCDGRYDQIRAPEAGGTVHGVEGG